MYKQIDRSGDAPVSYVSHVDGEGIVVAASGGEEQRLLVRAAVVT